MEIPHFENSLKGGFIVFLKHYNNTRKIENRSILIRAKDKYINGLKEKLSLLKTPDIKLDIQTDAIELSDYESPHVMVGDDFGEVANNIFLHTELSLKFKNDILQIMKCFLK